MTQNRVWLWAGLLVAGLACDDKKLPGTDAAGAEAGGGDGPVDAAVDSAAETAAEAPMALGPPTITSVVPQVVVAGGPVYVFGSSFGDLADVAAGRVTVLLRVVADTTDGGVDAGDGDGGVAVSELALQISQVTLQRLTALVPSDLRGLAGRVKLVVMTAAGQAESSAPMVVVQSSGFGGATVEGQGLLGRVYQLQPNTPSLPNFAMACTDPKVVNMPPASPCPFSALLVPNLAVTLRPFSAGFPGVQSDLVEWFAIRFAGRIVIPADGMYGFQSCSDDGSKLLIDGAMVLNNDGVHARSCARGQVMLTAGEHPIVVEYFQGPRYEIGLELFWTPPGMPEAIVPASAFRLDLAELAGGP